MRGHAERHDADYYKKVRGLHDIRDPFEKAARTIYLNKTCFNGLYRVNKAGNFNVPMGNYKNPPICDEENLRAVAEALKGVSVEVGSYERIAPGQGDLVYCDPPYDDTFTGYTSKGFDEEAQRHLRDCAEKWRKAGAHVILSNSDTPRIRSLFSHKAWKVVEVENARNINCKGDGRGNTLELLICSHE